MYNNSKMLRTCAMVVSMALFSASCTKEKDSLYEASNQKADEEVLFTYESHAKISSDSKSGSDEREMQLGAARQIPYSMANMRKALRFVNAHSKSAQIDQLFNSYGF